ncbi:MAG: hypothetical protein KatS3mg089_0831 [Patescibacteria group bacterium]|nr:MAG: hypothetical protein KatS3mg089_0831 [Patescibacteria group bacterium]
MASLKLKTITNLNDAKHIWEILSPKKRIYDDWNFRFSYYKYFKYPLFFYTLFQNDMPVGLLPLQYNTNLKILEFFGGNYMEDNNIFTNPDQKSMFYKKYLLRKFLQMSKYKVILDFMEEDIEGFHFQISDYKYELPLENLSSLNDYLTKYWKRKSRNNLKAQIKKLYNQKLIIRYDNFLDLEYMFELNIKKFGKESTLLFPHRIDFLKEIVRQFNSHLITISINSRKEAVGLSVLYNGIYIGLNSGTNPSINGLGKFLSLQKIEQAISLGAILYDARAGDLGWKEAFHFVKRPQYKLIIN